MFCRKTENLNWISVNREIHPSERSPQMPPNFYKRMTLVCSKIPYGKAATYGQIALLCGMPKNSRQVGYALRTGKAGEHVPAHRIVNAKGFLSGAAAFETSDMQKLLLEAEGIQVDSTEEGFRVDLKRFGWKNTMEEAEELRLCFLQEEI